LQEARTVITEAEKSAALKSLKFMCCI